MNCMQPSAYLYLDWKNSYVHVSKGSCKHKPVHSVEGKLKKHKKGRYAEDAISKDGYRSSRTQSKQHPQAPHRARQPVSSSEQMLESGLTGSRECHRRHLRNESTKYHHHQRPKSMSSAANSCQHDDQYRRGYSRKPTHLNAVQNEYYHNRQSRDASSSTGGIICNYNEQLQRENEQLRRENRVLNEYFQYFEQNRLRAEETLCDTQSYKVLQKTKLNDERPGEEEQLLEEYQEQITPRNKIEVTSPATAKTSRIQRK